MHPTVERLKQSVAAQSARQPASLADFEQLSAAIEEATGDHLNTDTLRRLWGAKRDSYRSVRLSTLNILARYAGCKDFADYCERQRREAQTESETTRERQTVYAADTEQGTEVVIGWQPDRVCRLRYKGGEQWEVVSAENSRTLQAGDVFRCAAMTAGEVLYGEKLLRDGKEQGAVRLGMDTGIVFIEKAG